MDALEDKPKEAAKVALQKGLGSLESVLAALDKVYGRATTFHELNLQLCNIKQHFDKTAKEYYERMMHLQVMLQEHHDERYEKGN